MEIRQLQLIEGARAARGLAVVIDVFRASSHAVVLLAGGVREILPVEEIAEARALKRRQPCWLLAGERGGAPPAGFDLGNSPAASARLPLAGRSVVLTTSAGTRGLIAAAERADEVVFGCFLNAAAIARHLARSAPEVVSLVAMGLAGERRTPEDDLCSDYLAGLLRGAMPDPQALFARIREHPEGRKFLDPAQPQYPAADLEACLRIDTHDVVPVLDRTKDLPRLLPAS